MMKEAVQAARSWEALKKVEEELYQVFENWGQLKEDGKDLMDLQEKLVPHFYKAQKEFKASMNFLFEAIKNERILKEE